MKSHATEKADLERSLVASEEILAEAQRLIEEFQYDKELICLVVFLALSVSVVEKVLFSAFSSLELDVFIVWSCRVSFPSWTANTTL